MPDDPNLVRTYIIAKIGVFCQITDKHVTTRGQMTDARGQQKLEKDQKQYLSPASLEPTESQRLKRPEIRASEGSKNQRSEVR